MQTGLTFPVPAYLVCSGKQRPLNGCLSVLNDHESLLCFNCK